MRHHSRVPLKSLVKKQKKNGPSDIEPLRTNKWGRAPGKQYSGLFYLLFLRWQVVYGGDYGYTSGEERETGEGSATSPKVM